MITKEEKSGLDVAYIVSVDELVPKDHILRKVQNSIDFSFIYDLVKGKYSENKGRPSIDPVVLIKIPLLQAMFGIKSMRQTIKDIEVNLAYRWFLGLNFCDKVPHFSTFGKNYTRRFEGTDLFEQIFNHILTLCCNYKLVNDDTIFIDATHIKACANRNKFNRKEVIKKQTKFYEESLRKEIAKDRKDHGKKELKDKGDNNDDFDGSCAQVQEMKDIKESKTDPESGWFHKGEHKEVFAYATETACDRHGWILGYTIHKGNEHDSTTFPSIYEKIKKFNPSVLVMDAGYKIPAIAKQTIDEGITPIFPYTRPKTKEGFFFKRAYKYDREKDCYICPFGEELKYSTTTREGYKEYKSDKKICANCPHLKQCTASKNTTKVVTRHVWEEYLEYCEEVRKMPAGEEIYKQRKETIERVFGTAKEHHGMRYTQQRGKSKMAMKVGLVYTAMNMKKLALLLHKDIHIIFSKIKNKLNYIKKQSKKLRNIPLPSFLSTV
ncbi:MAG: IS1182 family transposase [Bacillota bacterium]